MFSKIQLSLIFHTLLSLILISKSIVINVDKLNSYSTHDLIEKDLDMDLGMIEKINHQVLFGDPEEEERLNNRKNNKEPLVYLNNHEPEMPENMQESMSLREALAMHSIEDHSDDYDDSDGDWAFEGMESEL